MTCDYNAQLFVINQPVMDYLFYIDLVATYNVFGEQGVGWMNISAPFCLCIFTHVDAFFLEQILARWISCFSNERCLMDPSP